MSNLQYINVKGTKYNIVDTKTKAYQQQTNNTSNWDILKLGDYNQSASDYTGIKLDYNDIRNSGSFTGGNNDTYYMYGANAISSILYPEFVDFESEPKVIMNVYEANEGGGANGLGINVSTNTVDNLDYKKQTPAAYVCSFAGRTDNVLYKLHIQAYGKARLTN